MLITKSRLQGNSVVLTLPEENEERPEPNTKYIVMYSLEGTITLVPKIADLFVGGELAEFYEADEWRALQPEGEEIW